MFDQLEKLGKAAEQLRQNEERDAAGILEQLGRIGEELAGVADRVRRYYPGELVLTPLAVMV